MLQRLFLAQNTDNTSIIAPQNHLLRNAGLRNRPTSHFCHSLTYVCRRTCCVHTRRFQCSKFFLSSAFTASNNSASMPHTLTSWCCHPCDVRDHWFSHMRFNKGSRFFF